MNKKYFYLLKKRLKQKKPIVEDIYDVGTICEIKQILKLPGDTVRVLVEGKTRGRIVNYLEEEPFLKVEIEEIEDNQYEDDKEVDALIRLVKTNFDEYIKLSGDSSSDLNVGVEDLEEPGKIADVIGSYININQEEKQDLIGIIDSKERLEKILIIINEEIEILKIERKIGIKVKNKIDKVQKEYYLKEQLKAIQEELGEDEEDKKEINLYKEKINKAKLPKEVKEKAIYELDRLKNSGNFSAEGGVIRAYLDWILSLPWNKDTKDNLDIKKARDILDKEHYGLKDVKDRIIEYLAVRKVSKTLKGPILCLVGPPGVGKTSIAKSIAHSLNRNFVRMSLGGVRDEAEIRGHRKTYVGAIPGRIIYGMKQAKSRNPLFLLDEIDKMSNDFRGDPADALLEVLDAEQNATFRDHYLELDFDLSKVLFITTANTLSTIPGPLLDRMEIIEVSGYTSEEKFYIARNHLIPKKLKEHNMEDGKITFSNSSIYYIIDNYTRESGVRGLERKISSIIRKSITEMIEKNKDTTNITINHVKKYWDQRYFPMKKQIKRIKLVL